MSEARIRGGSRRGPRRPRLRTRTKLALSAALLAGVTSVATVGSWAAWTVSETNGTNTFTTSTVLIADSQGGEGGSANATGSALFDVTNLEPGGAATECIGVDIAGNATVSALSLAATVGGSAALAHELTVQTAVDNTSGTVAVTPGTDTGNGSCAGYPTGGTDTAIGVQGASLAAWAGGGPYAVTDPVTDTWYRFSVDLPSTASCASVCGQTTTISLTWTLTTA